MPTIPKFEAWKFDALSWAAGSIHDMNIPCCEEHICAPANAAKLRTFAVGYCLGEDLKYRPKEGEVAIMFVMDGRQFWFHLRKREFERVFGPIPWQDQRRGTTLRIGVR